MKGLVFLWVVLIFGCHTIQEPDKPKKLLTKQQMADIIFDMLLLNSAKGIDRDVLQNNNISPEGYIYKKYNIDSLQFVENNSYYAFRVKDYRDIYNIINTKLEVLKATYDSIAPKTIEEAPNDSLIALPEKSLQSVE